MGTGWLHLMPLRRVLACVTVNIKFRQRSGGWGALSVQWPAAASRCRSNQCGLRAILVRPSSLEETIMSFRLFAVRGTRLWNGPARLDLVGRAAALGFGERSVPARTRGSVHADTPPANVSIAALRPRPLSVVSHVTAREHAHPVPAEVRQQEAASATACNHTEQPSHEQAPDPLTWYLRRALRAEHAARIG